MRAVLLTAVAVLALATPAVASERLDAAAEGLRGSPLYVHPELTYLIGAPDRARIVEALRNAHLTFDVRIVALPALEADESGGELDRALWAIDDRLVPARRLIIGIDQRGDFEVVDDHVGRDIDLPFELEYGREGEEARGTIVPRLERLFAIAAAAEPASSSYARERPTGPLDPLPEDRPPDENDEDGSPAWAIMLGSGVAGMFAGLVGFGLALAIRWLRHA